MREGVKGVSSAVCHSCGTVPLSIARYPTSGMEELEEDV